MPYYIICSCGAWNSQDDYHKEIYGERCYMCRRALFADMPVTEVKTTILFRNRSRSLVRCTGWSVDPRKPHGVTNGCGRKIAVKNLEYIQDYWYTEPHGCSEGDYWNLGEGQFVCPHCGRLNRLFARHDVVDLKPHFKSVVDKHDR